MAMGRGNAAAAAATATATTFLLLLLLPLFSAAAGSVKYTVGDNLGWTYGVSSWAEGKKFKAGDVLSFNYLRMFHNVVEVDSGHFRNCTFPPGAKVHATGRDEVVLSKGENFFICSIPFHCQLGMRISAFAA